MPGCPEPAAAQPCRPPRPGPRPGPAHPAPAALPGAPDWRQRSGRNRSWRRPGAAGGQLQQTGLEIPLDGGLRRLWRLPGGRAGIAGLSGGAGQFAFQEQAVVGQGLAQALGGADPTRVGQLLEDAAHQPGELRCAAGSIGQRRQLVQQCQGLGQRPLGRQRLAQGLADRVLTQGVEQAQYRQVAAKADHFQAQRLARTELQVASARLDQLASDLQRGLALAGFAHHQALQHLADPPGRGRGGGLRSRRGRGQGRESGAGGLHKSIP